MGCGPRATRRPTWRADDYGDPNDNAPAFGHRRHAVADGQSDRNGNTRSASVSGHAVTNDHAHTPPRGLGPPDPEKPFRNTPHSNA